MLPERDLSAVDADEVGGRRMEEAASTADEAVEEVIFLFLSIVNVRGRHIVWVILTENVICEYIFD